MEFWVVPNQAGLPTVSGAAVVADGGINPNAGKGALITLAPGTTVADASTFIKLEWSGATVTYDDLGFFDDTVGFIIPDVDPPILRVRMWTFLLWPPTLGSFAAFHGFVGFNVPVTGGGFNELPETGSAVRTYRNTLAGAPIPVNSNPLNTAPLNAFVGQITGAPRIITQQQMAIEVVQ